MHMWHHVTNHLIISTDKDSNSENRIKLRVRDTYPPTSTRPHLLYQHTLSCMSSDGNDDLAYEYPAGAIADSPIPFSQENTIDTPVSVPIPIVNFTTMQPLNPIAPVFSPRPVTVSSSASDVAAMFRGLHVHTPTPLTPDSQHAARQANKTVTVSFAPAERRGGQAGPGLELGTATGSEATLGATTATTHQQRAGSNGSATNHDLRRCARCREQNQYCYDSDGKDP
jgi:hypothetical protein